MKMTVSLLSSYDWFAQCPSSYKQSALDAIISSLSKQYIGTQATKRGEEFEHKINNALQKDATAVSALYPLSALRGMEMQRWITPLVVDIVYKEMPLSFMFRGKIDFYGVPLKEFLNGWDKKKVIVDLKTTCKPIRQDKYTTSMQHVVYCLAMGVSRFVYIVCRFEDEISLDPTEIKVFPIDATDDMEQYRNMLKQKLIDFVDFLHTHNLWDTYTNIFNK